MKAKKQFNFMLLCFNVLMKYWAVLWIVAVWFIFAYPYFLKGLVPFPSRYLVDFFSPWNNYFGMPVKNNAIPDVITQIYPWKKIVIDSWQNGQIPFWNPYQFAGNPHLANYQSAAFTPMNVLFFLLPFVDAWSLLVLLQPLLAGLFMYLFIRELKVSRVGSMVSSIAFMFSGFITVWMAYGTLAWAILFLPLLLYGIERYFNKQDRISAIVIVLSIPLSLFSGHFQTSLYFLLTGALYILFKFTQKRSFKLFVVCCLLFVVGLILSLPQLIPSIQFYQQSVRSGLFQKGEAIPWNYLVTVIAPDFFGNPVTRNDWFGYYAEWASFAGVIPLMLALLVILQKKKPRIVLFFGGSAIISLLLAYRTPLLDLIVKLRVPVISTSAVSRVIVLFSFSIAILAGYGFDFLRNCTKNQQSIRKIVLYIMAWIGVISTVWLLLLSGNLLFVRHIAAKLDVFTVAKRNFILPTFMVLASAVLLLSGFIVHRLVKKAELRKSLLRITYYVLLIMISFDMLRFVTKWMPFDEREYVYPKNEALEYLQKNAGDYRVFGNFNNSATSMFSLYGIEGYDPLYIRRYGELMTAAADGIVRNPSRSVVNLDKNGRNTKKILDLLSVKYILHSKGDKRNIWAFPFWEFPESFGKPVYRDEKYEIYKNTKSFPRAFLVYDYKIANSDQEIVDLMFDGDADLSKTVILEEKPNVDSRITEQYNSKVRLPRVGGLPQYQIGDRYGTQQSRAREEHDFRTSNGAIVNSARITKYTPNEIEIEVQTNQPALLFLSDNYYPGWNAYVNGKRTKIHRADYTFRAVEIPQGRSTVKFVYENWYFKSLSG